MRPVSETGFVLMKIKKLAQAWQVLCFQLRASQVSPNDHSDLGHASPVRDMPRLCWDNEAPYCTERSSSEQETPGVETPTVKQARLKKKHVFRFPVLFFRLHG